MRIIKLAIISVIIFSLILFLMSLLIPSQVRISRAINIESSGEAIYNRIADINEWKEWNELAHDSIKITVQSDQKDHFETAWEYNGRTIHSAFWLQESANVTVVQWYFDFSLKWYPWEKFGSIIFDKQFGPPMEKSLKNLKIQMENSP